MPNIGILEKGHEVPREPLSIPYFDQTRIDAGKVFSTFCMVTSLERDARAKRRLQVRVSVVVRHYLAFVFSKAPGVRGLL